MTHSFGSRFTSSISPRIPLTQLARVHERLPNYTVQSHGCQSSRRRLKATKCSSRRREQLVLTSTASHQNARHALLLLNEPIHHSARSVIFSDGNRGSRRGPLPLPRRLVNAPPTRRSPDRSGGAGVSCIRSSTLIFMQRKVSPGDTFEVESGALRKKTDTY